MILILKIKPLIFSFCSFMHMVVCIFSTRRPSAGYLEIVWAGLIFARYIRQLAVCLITMWILWPCICCFSGFTSAFIMLVCKYTKGTLFDYIMMEPWVYLPPPLYMRTKEKCVTTKGTWLLLVINGCKSTGCSVDQRLSCVCVSKLHTVTRDDRPHQVWYILWRDLRSKKQSCRFQI